nr:FAD-binding oxidoreductase [Aerococcus urinae]
MAPDAVIYPRSPDEVLAVVKLAAEEDIALIPYGGGSSVVGGINALAKSLGGAVVTLDTTLMTRLIQIDKIAMTATVEAGIYGPALEEALQKHGVTLSHYPQSFQYSTLGGWIAARGAGQQSNRYGKAEKWLVSARLATPKGFWTTEATPASAAGPNLNQLVAGSEGTLGVVTRAVLRLRPKPMSQDTAFVAVEEFGQLSKFLRHMERALGGTLSAFEVMWEDFYKLVTTEPAKGKAPLAYGHPYYVLVESMGGDQEADSARFEAALMAALEAGEVSDAIIAKNQAERDQMWSLRDDVAQVARNWPIFTFDVSLKIADMESYIAEVREGLKAKWPAHTLMVFGHLGDGNLHVIPGTISDHSPESRKAVEAVVYGALRKRGGSVSAEHGIGLEKRPYLGWSRSPEEVALMRVLKQALDPKNILNPGKVLEPASPRVKAAE